MNIKRRNMKEEKNNNLHTTFLKKATHKEQ